VPSIFLDLCLAGRWIDTAIGEWSVVFQVASYKRLRSAHGGAKEVPFMEKDNHLLEWAVLLKAIRSKLQPDLDASIFGELDSVIAQIEAAAASGIKSHRIVAARNALSLVARLIEVVTNVADLISRIPN
jgi:hypothetical protein